LKSPISNLRNYVLHKQLGQNPALSDERGKYIKGCAAAQPLSLFSVFIGQMHNPTNLKFFVSLRLGPRPLCVGHLCPSAERSWMRACRAVVPSAGDEGGWQKTSHSTQLNRPRPD
jgi:hypothetical protein